MKNSRKSAPQGLSLSCSRVGGWRASFRVRWHVRRFRSGPQSGSPGRVSSPPLIKPDVRISRIRLSDGIMPPHVAQSGVSEHCVALMALASGHALPPFCAVPEVRPLSSAGITRRPQSYGPVRHPAGPDWSSRISGWRPPATDRASRVAALSIFHACRRHYPGGNGPVRLPLASRTAIGLPLISGGSTPALPFSRPARRSLAFRPAWSLSRPKRPFCTRVLQSTSLPP